MSARPKASLLLGALLVALLSACETRDATNPFDPENPHTEGTPALLNAQARDGVVDLDWDLSGYDGVSAVRVLRKTPAASEHLLFEQPGRGAGSFHDDGLINRLEYSYRLELQDRHGAWVATVPDSARPGSSQVWVLDIVAGGVLRLAPDGRDVDYRILGSNQLLDLAVDADGSLWVADYFAGFIYHSSLNGDRLDEIELAGANTVGLDGEDLWVGSFLDRRVVRLARDGRVLSSDPEAGRVEDLLALGNGEGAWVASRDSTVSHLTASGVAWRRRDFVWPIAVAADSVGPIFVADRATDKVSAIARDGSSVTQFPASFSLPVDLAIDGAGGLWVADSERGALVHLNDAGTEIGAVELGPIESVTRDRATGELWVTAGSSGQVFRLDPDGTPRTRLRLSGRPIRVEGRWSAN